MKKRGFEGRIFLVFASLILAVFMLSLVSAGILDDITAAINDIVKPASPILKFIIGDTPDGEMLLVKMLALILISAVAYNGTRKVPGIQDSKALSSLVAITVAILGTRYLTSKQIVEFIWLPQGVFAVAIATLTPFILYFFLIESFESRVVRKVGWIIFAVMFLALSIYRWDNLKVGTEWWNNLGWWYIIIGVLSLLAVYFDRQLRSRFVLSSLGKDLSKRNLMSIARLMEEMDGYIKVRDRAIRMNDHAAQTTAEREISRLNVQIAKLK